MAEKITLNLTCDKHDNATFAVTRATYVACWNSALHLGWSKHKVTGRICCEVCTKENSTAKKKRARAS